MSPREIDTYVREARRMRSDYLAALLKGGIGSVRRFFRGVVRSRARSKAHPAELLPWR